MILLSSCKQVGNNNIHIIWEDQRAKAVSVPISLASDVPADSIGTLIKICLHGQDHLTGIFGKYTRSADIIFEPVIPFTAGADYEVWVRGKKSGSFTVKALSLTIAPHVIAIYPSPDTLPENLLKIYVQFSEPMQEAQSAQHIGLIRNNKDTLTNVFLNLQPELWNDNRTVITIWLDPGRIKRNLQPNIRLGNPLQEKNKYTLFVTHGWKDAQGSLLTKDFSKAFIAAKRDDLSPVATSWIIQAPAANSQQPVDIDLRESLDHFLLEETLRIINETNTIVKGKWIITGNDSHCQFIPTEKWRPGNYSLQIESKLEDLAGNNLNRPFDRDITKSKTPPDTGVYRRSFKVQ